MYIYTETERWNKRTFCKEITTCLLLMYKSNLLSQMLKYIVDLLLTLFELYVNTFWNWFLFSFPCIFRTDYMLILSGHFSLVVFRTKQNFVLELDLEAFVVMCLAQHGWTKDFRTIKASFWKRSQVVRWRRQYSGNYDTYNLISFYF